MLIRVEEKYNLDEILYKLYFRKVRIILRVKFHFKHITYIILIEEREIILYEPLNSGRWKDLNKINDE
jgi:hypothetical protein